MADPREPRDRGEPARSRRRGQSRPEPPHGRARGPHGRSGVRRPRSAPRADGLRPRPRRRPAHGRHRLAGDAQREDARLQPPLLQGPARLRDSDGARRVGRAAGARLPVAPPGRVGPASEAPLQGRDGGQRRGARRPPSRARSAAAPLPVRGQPAASARTSLPRGLLGPRIRGRPDRAVARRAARRRSRPHHRLRPVRSRVPAIDARDPTQRSPSPARRPPRRGGEDHRRGALRDEPRRRSALPPRR